MSAAVPHRSGARPAEARRPSGNPWVVELRELGRRAGSLQELDRSIPAPAGWKVELVGVPEGAPVHLDLRLVGSCARCLDEIEDTLDLDVQELFAYEGSTTEETSEEDEVRRVEGDHLDLEPLVRDTVVLSLPLAPVCTEDCAGLCVDCGQRLDDLPPDHAHEVLDPRWAGLTERFASSSGTPDETPTPEEN